MLPCPPDSAHARLAVQVYHYLSTRSVGPVERATLEQCMAQLKVCLCLLVPTLTPIHCPVVAHLDALKQTIGS